MANITLTVCECFKGNPNVNKGYFESVIVLDAKRIVYMTTVTLQYQRRGAFLAEIVPWFKLNKFTYYVLIWCFICT